MDEILGDIRYAGVLSRRLLLRSFSFGGRSFIIQSDLKRAHGRDGGSEDCFKAAPINAYDSLKQL